MLGSQRHYYWIGGGIWVALMLAGVVLVVIAGLRGEGGGGGLGDALNLKTFPEAAIVTGDPAEQGVLLTEAGAVDIGAAGLTLTDPLADPGRPAFDLEVPEGRYPALIYRPDDAPRVIGMVALRLSDAPVSSWQKAGRKGRPIDLYFSTDEVMALGDAEAVATLEGDTIREALAGTTAPVPFATVTALGRDVLLLDPSFETFSANIYAGFDAEGRLVMLVKDFGYFGTRDALEQRKSN